MSVIDSQVFRSWFLVIVIMLLGYMVLVYTPLLSGDFVPNPIKILYDTTKGNTHDEQKQVDSIGIHHNFRRNSTIQQRKKPRLIRNKDTTAFADLEWLDYKVGSDYGDGTCARSHSIARLQGILQRWHDIATKNNITYWLNAGSLIGVVRDGQFIPWDTDLDVHIDFRDVIKLDAIKDKHAFDTYSEKFHLALDMDWRVFPVSSRRRVSCDGRLDTRDSCTFSGPVGRLIKGYEKYLDIWDLEILNGMAYDRYTTGWYFPLVDIFPLKKCLLSGITTFCPRNPKVIFDAWYGKDVDLAPGWICKKGNWVKRRRDTGDK